MYRAADAVVWQMLFCSRCYCVADVVVGQMCCVADVVNFRRSNIPPFSSQNDGLGVYKTVGCVLEMLKKI